jgi:hypothetical protein
MGVFKKGLKHVAIHSKVTEKIIKVFYLPTDAQVNYLKKI